MARNTKAEYEWEKERYFRFVARLVKEDSMELYENMHKDFSNAEFLTKALQLYKDHPEYFK